MFCCAGNCRNFVDKSDKFFPLPKIKDGGKGGVLAFYLPTLRERREQSFASHFQVPCIQDGGETGAGNAGRYFPDPPKTRSPDQIQRTYRLCVPMENYIRDNNRSYAVPHCKCNTEQCNPPTPPPASLPPSLLQELQPEPLR